MRHRDVLSPEDLRELAALDAALAGDPVDDDLRDLALLARDVRSSAPPMSPAFAARLEREVTDGFPRPERPNPLRGRRWFVAPALGIAATVLVALVVVLPSVRDDAGDRRGAGTGGGPVAEDTSSERQRELASPKTDEATSAQPSPAPSPTVTAPAGAAPPPADVAPARGPRKQERSAVLVLEARDGEVESVADQVIRTTDRFGGIVRASSIRSDAETGGEASFDLRIPTDRLDDALAALSKLGHVAQRQQDGVDITGSFASVQERLSDARAERRGLLRALGRATSERQVDSLRARLRAVTSRIGRLKGDLAALRRRADLATVSVTLREAEDDSGGGDPGPWTPGDAARDAARVLAVAAGMLLVALAAAVPLALVGGAALLGARVARRRRREAALEAS